MDNSTARDNDLHDLLTGPHYLASHFWKERA